MVGQLMRKLEDWTGIIRFGGTIGIANLEPR